MSCPSPSSVARKVSNGRSPRQGMPLYCASFDSQGMLQTRGRDVLLQTQVGRVAKSKSRACRSAMSRRGTHPAEAGGRVRTCSMCAPLLTSRGRRPRRLGGGGVRPELGWSHGLLVLGHGCARHGNVPPVSGPCPRLSLKGIAIRVMCLQGHSVLKSLSQRFLGRWSAL